MNNFHTFDENSIETLKDILFSSDKDAVRVAVEILKNSDINDEKTKDFIKYLGEESTIKLYNNNPEVLQSIVNLFVYFFDQKIFDFPEYELDRSKEHRTDISVFETAIIEYKFNIRKELAKEWLESPITDERKKEIENEINILNHYVANLMNVSYEYRH